MATTRIDRPIICGFCQRKLDPSADEIAIMGVGKRDDGPGAYLALCSTRRADGGESQCVQQGRTWAAHVLNQQPVFLSYEEWRARPVRRTITATRTPKGHYDLQLTETHLNSFYFLDRANSKKPEQAKKIIDGWKDQWELPESELPDIDKLDAEGLATEPNVKTDRSVAEKLTSLRHPTAENNFPAALRRELERHSRLHAKHLLKNLESDGDDCKSCRISRGIKKVFVLTCYTPLISACHDMLKEAAAHPMLFSKFGGVISKQCEEMQSVFSSTMNLTTGDDEGNEVTLRKGSEEVALAMKLLADHGFFGILPGLSKTEPRVRSRKKKPR